MKRRQFVQRIGVTGFLAGLGSSVWASEKEDQPKPSAPLATDPAPPVALIPPKSGPIPVAFLISNGAVVIDFCGPWEVFQDVPRIGPASVGFKLFTVSESTAPLRASGGMQIVPDYDFQNAPLPKILVIPAQSGANEPTKEWVRRATRQTDLTMSVCNGAFLLASTGLLAGRAATAHHSSYADLAMAYPDISVKRGVRFVEDGNLATAGGLTSGIDLAMRVVERYFGRDIARKTAYAMEYQGQGWMNVDSNAVYVAPPTAADATLTCPVCWMDVDTATAPQSVYAGKTYWFCTPGHKRIFDAAPAKFIGAQPGRAGAPQIG
ncbi:MAG TPA: DJ-1/PfpI family protein [Steroidobacteraceae bacterium]|nr:DJ-1/PfpI family protein [Steroidobacteraceae bacterium]